MLKVLRRQTISFFLPLSFIFLLWQQAPERLKIIQSSYHIESPPPFSNLDPKLIGIITLGHKNIYDDFISIWILQTLMDSRKRDPDRLITSIRSVIRHRPKLETTYMLSCFVLIREFSKPQYCQEIILAGLKAFPTSWRLPMTQGYVHYFLLKEPAQSASFFMMAASRPRSPPYVRSLVSKLLKENSLTPEDVKKSLDIASQNGGDESFQNLLNIFGKLKDTQSMPRK